MLLSQHYDKHPIIILKDVKFDELKAMLDYMYRGEVNISQEQLSTFLKAAETLQIKGLTDAGSDEGNGLHSNRPPSSNSTTSANEDPQSPGPPGDGGSSPGPRKRKRNKHGDDGEGDSGSKVSLSESSDRLSATSVGSPSGSGTKSGASVKREPTEGEGDGQISVDDSGEVVMMSRPGPSNGGTNNKAPWILSADSSGEEMQLTPGQGLYYKVNHHSQGVGSGESTVTNGLIGIFPCEACNKVYNRRGNLFRHLRYECGKDPQFSCPACGKKFFRKDKLVIHTKVHQHCSDNSLPTVGFPHEAVRITKSGYMSAVN